jgi:hypothetical protein
MSRRSSPPPSLEISHFASLLGPADFAREYFQFQPDDHQARILVCDAKRVILNCSRQWGKSTVVAAKAVHRAVQIPESLILVASPSERQSGEFIRKAKTFLRCLDILPRGDGTNRNSVLLPNRSRFVGLTDVEDTTRGFSAVSMLIFDEAALVSDELYRALRPVLSVSSGALWLLSTPNGKRGFFYREWVHGEGWTRFTVPASECPRIPAAFLEQELRDLGRDYFNQEYMGQFFAPSDAIFEEPAVRAALAPGPGPLFDRSYELIPEDWRHTLKREFFIGLDLGQRRDRTAIVVMETAQIASQSRSALTFAPECVIRRSVRHLERLSVGTPYPDVVERATRIADRLSDAASTTLIVDATGVGIPVVDALRKPAARWRLAPVIIGSGYRDNYVDGFWRVAKQDLIGRLQLAFDFREFTIEPSLPETETLVEELTAMRGFERKRGRTLEAPGAAHDDLALALALAWWGVETRHPATLGVDKRLL